MTILDTGVSAVTVGGLLDADLRIPHYQRPYSWEPSTALQLLDDIQGAMQDHVRRDVPYVLGTVILHDTGHGLDVVDGQQRLLTLRMTLLLLEPHGAATHDRPADTPVGRVRAALGRQIAVLDTEQRDTLSRFIRNECQLVRVVTDDVDEAFRVFDSQNYRGKPLAPHDLLKAYHLREMHDETAAMKVAVVEAWESVKDAELDRLFSIYLYRIVRWSRGESAPGFTIHDIGMFKGISPRGRRAPSARYHIAAQAALPMFDALAGASAANKDRNAGHSRFQFDAPLLVGRPFFEMVSFMLAELRRVAREGFTADRVPFSSYALGAPANDDVVNGDVMAERPSRNRYRYVSELYLAALLYYMNKFGDEDLAMARDRLFAWAYAPRVRLDRVQLRSIDNHASGGQAHASAFALLRHAESGRVLRQLSASRKPYSDKHERELVALLDEMEA